MFGITTIAIQLVKWYCIHALFAMSIDMNHMWRSSIEPYLDVYNANGESKRFHGIEKLKKEHYQNQGIWFGIDQTYILCKCRKVFDW